MTASGDGRPPRAALPAPAAVYAAGPPPPDQLLQSQLLFRKHKVLPHPKRGTYPGLREGGRPARRHGLSIDTALTAAAAAAAGSQPPSPRALKHQVRRIGSGPDPPPTPPAHSRTSSSTQSVAIPPSPTCVDSPARSTENVRPRLPSTPTNQMSPPTPDVTPPRSVPDRRARAAPRPAISERVPSKATTTTDSRTESFKTARENPSSDDDEEKSTLRPPLASARTSQITVRKISKELRVIHPLAVGLGLGLESGPEGSLTPKSKREFIAFDGDWGSASEVEQEWDDNLSRNVTVRKRRAPALVNGHRNEVIEDVTVSPTNAAKAVRAMKLPQHILAFPSPHDVQEPLKPPAVSLGPSTSESSFSTDARRFSGMSSKSTVSTVVEAILVDTPPTRQKTLRHIKKQSLLRDSVSDLSPGSSAPTSLAPDDGSRRRATTGATAGRRYNDARHESIATTNSISSGRARRQVWKNGGIPVIIVPERQSSVRSSSKEPSLRSTSSRKSKRSQSLNSIPLLHRSRSRDLAPYFERPTRRGRAGSESDGSLPGDQRTIDYPPMVPRRTSSLSAPTSRNGSRAPSLTADSLKAHNALQTQLRLQKDEPESGSTQVVLPEVKIQPAASSASLYRDRDRHGHDQEDEHRLSVDPHGDPLFGKRLSAQNTPFSLASVETSAASHHSHAEVSEALAVSLYPHQNTSILMVDHRPSESSDGSLGLRARGRADTRERDVETPPATRPIIRRIIDHDAAGPVTPPQAHFSMDDVDSPLRNPRAPPEPPAIKFIPATPSGLTPGIEREKQLGNFFDEAVAEKPSRSRSLVRRVLERRRHSEYGPSASRSYGLLSRTFSLTRNMRRSSSDKVASVEKGKGPAAPDPYYSGPESEPADGARLHPFWRPASSYDSGGEDDDFVHDAAEETYRYPRIDNRPPPPRRSLSSRMKRTFAILPIPDSEEYYPATSLDGPDRRTVRRTASGNLRVVKHRASLESLRQRAAADGRPFTAPEHHGRKRLFWRSQPLIRTRAAREQQEHREDGRGSGFFPALGSKIGEYGLRTIPRRLSEKRRERRSNELRQKISGPRDVRDGVVDVIRRNSYRDSYAPAQPA